MCHVAYANILPWTYNKAQGLLAVNHLASWTSLVLTSVCCVLSAMSFFSRLSPALFLSSLQGLSILLVWKPHKISVLKLKYCVWYKAGILYTQSPIGWWLVCLSSLVDARFHHWVMIGWWCGTSWEEKNIPSPFKVFLTGLKLKLMWDRLGRENLI